MAKDIKGDTLKAGKVGTLQVVTNLKKLPRAAATYSHVRVQHPNGKIDNLLLTDHELARALRRGDKNPEDIPEVSWLRSMIDGVRFDFNAGK